MDPEFDTQDVFDVDYLYFYEPLLGDVPSDAATDRICSLGPIGDGDRVLDLACGHGRIANRLAERGATVTGLDVAPSFLGLARTDAAVRGVWFTSFGYFDDGENRRILAGIHRSLAPGGRLLLELNHGPALWAGFLPEVTSRRGEDVMTDRHHYDALTGRVHTERTVVRNGKARSFRFSNRIFAVPELRDWLLTAGFRHVDAYGPDGMPLEHEARRMIVRASR